MAYSIYLYMGGSLDETSQILKGNHSSLILQFEQEHNCSYASKGTPNDFMHLRTLPDMVDSNMDKDAQRQLSFMPGSHLIYDGYKGKQEEIDIFKRIIDGLSANLVPYYMAAVNQAIPDELSKTVLFGYNPITEVWILDKHIKLNTRKSHK